MYEVVLTNGSTKVTIHDSNYQRLASGTISQSINAVCSFTFTLYPWNTGYNAINPRTSTVTVTNTKLNEVEFEGYVLETSESMTSEGVIAKTVICEDYLGYLCNSIQMYQNYEKYTPKEFLTELLKNHRSTTESSQYIYIGNVYGFSSTASKTTAYRTTLEEIKENLTSRLSGEISIRNTGGKLYLDYFSDTYVENNLEKSTTQIKLAKNLKEITVATDASAIITRLYPLGAKLYEIEQSADSDVTAERLTIESVNNGKAYIDDEDAMAVYGVICGTYEWDDVTLASNLLTKGKEYLTQNNKVKHTYEITALDLSTIGLVADEFRLGVAYQVTNSLMGIDEYLRVIARDIDINEPMNSRIEIGDKYTTISDIVTETRNYAEYTANTATINSASATLEVAKQSASQLIAEGINGYVVVNENEICIMNTPDKDTATQVWRWNMGGLAYSKGYDAESVVTAITMDGSIVADAITTGTLTAIAIDNGNGTFSVSENGEVTASAFNMTGGSIALQSDSSTDDRIDISYNEWTLSMSPLQWKLENSNENFYCLAQAGALFFFEDGEKQSTISSYIETNGDIRSGGDISASGDITAENITAVNVSSSDTVSATKMVHSDEHMSTEKYLYCSDVKFELDEGSGVFYSLRNLYNAVFG